MNGIPTHLSSRFPFSFRQTNVEVALKGQRIGNPFFIGPGNTVLSMMDSNGKDVKLDADALFDTMKQVSVRLW